MSDHQQRHAERSGKRRKTKTPDVAPHTAPKTHYFQLPFRRSTARKRKRPHEENSDASEEDENRAINVDDPPEDNGEAEEDTSTIGGAFSMPALTGGDFAPRERRNIKYQHLVALNTLLHKALMDHDYPRANRAFGLLLRVDINGRRVDIRQKNLWGMGAEILLHLGPGDQSGLHEDGWYTDEGFEKAKAYYERLILQYPWNKYRPDAVSAATFYPVMFDLWIMQVQARDRRKQQIIEAEASSSSEEDDDDVEEDESLDENSTEQRRRHAKDQIVAQAEEIYDRLDDLTSQVAYDENVQIHRRLGMVSLWLLGLKKQARGGDLNINTEDTETERVLRQRASDAFNLVTREGGTVNEDLLNAAEKTNDKPSHSVKFSYLDDY